MQEYGYVKKIIRKKQLFHLFTYIPLQQDADLSFDPSLAPVLIGITR